MDLNYCDNCEEGFDLKNLQDCPDCGMSLCSDCMDDHQCHPCNIIGFSDADLDPLEDEEEG